MSERTKPPGTTAVEHGPAPKELWMNTFPAKSDPRNIAALYLSHLRPGTVAIQFPPEATTAIPWAQIYAAAAERAVLREIVFAPEMQLLQTAFEGRGIGGKDFGELLAEIENPLWNEQKRSYIADAYGNNRDAFQSGITTKRTDEFGTVIRDLVVDVVDRQLANPQKLSPVSRLGRKTNADSSEEE